MERRSRPGEPQLDPSFANRFLADARKLDRRYGIADAVGLQDPIHRETLTRYLGLRMLRDEITAAEPVNFRNEHLRGVIKPLVYYFHRHQGIRNPYLAAHNSYEASYEEHIIESYPDEASRSVVFHIQTVVGDLIRRMTVRHEMPSFFTPQRGIVFDMWSPSRDAVQRWGNEWRDRLVVTQRPREL